MDLSTPFNDIEDTPVNLLDIMVYSCDSYVYKEIVVGYIDTKLRLVYYPLLSEHTGQNTLHQQTRVLSGSKYAHKGMVIGKFTDLPSLEWINKILHKEVRELLLKIRNERY